MLCIALACSLFLYQSISNSDWLIQPHTCIHPTWTQSCRKVHVSLLIDDIWLLTFVDEYPTTWVIVSGTPFPSLPPPLCQYAGYYSHILVLSSRFPGISHISVLYPHVSVCKLGCPPVCKLRTLSQSPSVTVYTCMYHTLTVQWQCRSLQICLIMIGYVLSNTTQWSCGIVWYDMYIVG